MEIISIVIPAYNEEENIEELYKKINKVITKIDENYEILFIDDGSTDSTSRIIERIISQNRNVKLIIHGTNQGIGRAISTGLKAATGDTIITLDSDLSHDANNIMNFIKEIRKGYDVVIGSRYVGNGGMINVPTWRIVVSKFAGFLFSVLFSMFDIKDKTSGYRAYSTLVKNINIISTSFSVQLEILIKMRKKGAKMKEIPILLTWRKRGHSKFKIFKIMRAYLRMVINLKLS